MTLTALMAATAYCIVGSNTGSPDLEALHVLKCDTDTGAAEIVQTVKGIEGTTYFQLSPDRKTLYTVVGEKRDVKTRSAAVAFPIADGCRLGEMRRLADLPCEAPCHVALSPDGTLLAFAAYCSGTVATLRLSPATNAVRAAVLPNVGMGPNLLRQQKAYAHCSLFLPDGRLAVVDLGTDRIHFFSHPAELADRADAELRFDPGDGPRHAILSADGRVMYVIDELSSTVRAFSRTAGKGFEPLGKWSMLPQGYDRWEADGKTLATKAAAIKMTADGKFLLASNRGHDSIAVFAVAPDGTLGLRNIARLSGKFPRDFAFFPGERFVAVGHKMSNEIQIYAFDRERATLTPVGRPLKAWRPLCFQFI